MGASLTYAEYDARRHVPVLDGVRAVSILLVVTHHPIYPAVWPSFHGATGVSIFFVLSGYLITMLLLREERKSGGISLVAFYTRRLFRLAPLFLLALALYLVLILVLGMQTDRRDSFVENIPYYLMFLPEHAMFFNSYPDPVPFGGTWSLGIEEKFYFVWPLLGFVLLKMRDVWRAVALGAVFLASVILGFLGGAWGMALSPYGLLALGCLLAIALARPKTYSVAARFGEQRFLFPACVVFLALQFGTDAIMPGGVLYVLYGVVVAVVLCGLVVTRAPWTGFLTTRPMVLVGTLSYGLYLFHNFGLNLAEMFIPQTTFWWSLLSTSVGLGVSVLGCWILHKLVEQPSIKIGHRLSTLVKTRAASGSPKSTTALSPSEVATAQTDRTAVGGGR
jgi:peptidoglycan/LPS O-acetylase OafA/YrhL